MILIGVSRLSFRIPRYLKVFEISPAGKFANRMDFTVLTKRQIQFVLHQDNGEPDVKLLFEFLLVRFNFFALLFELWLVSQRFVDSIHSCKGIFRNGILICKQFPFPSSGL
jgi:hypothetical protein